jgi:hypothetical protein
MTLKAKLILHAVVAVALVVAFIVVAEKCGAGKIKIVKETVEVEKIKYLPTNCGEYKACFEDPLHIETLLKMNSLFIACGNKCRGVSKTVEMECKPESSPKKNSIVPRFSVLVGGGDGMGYALGGGIMYLRKWVLPGFEIGFGGGPTFYRLSPFDAKKKPWTLGGGDIAVTIDF